MSAFHDKTTNAARGKWRGILAELGAGELPRNAKKHGPCPICGGTDRFRFDDKEGRGTWICNHCGAGSGMELAMRLTGMGFAECASRIDGIVGNIKPEAPRQQPEMTDDERRRMLNEIWLAAAVPAEGDLLHRYLAARCIPEAPLDVRLHPACRDGEGGVHPCMVAIVRDADGKPVSLHRTFLRRDGLAKAEIEKPRKYLGGIPDGSAIRLGPANRILGIAEGIETALAASALFELPVWSAMDAGNLSKWSPPAGTEEVIVLGDSDEGFAGQAAAYTLARRIRHNRPEIHVTVRLPEIGSDWNDVLISKQRTA